MFESKKGKPASRSKLTNANSVALELERCSLPFILLTLEGSLCLSYTLQFVTRRFVDGSEGIKYEVRAMHAARTKRTVVRKEKTPFTRCTVVCIDDRLLASGSADRDTN